MGTYYPCCRKDAKNLIASDLNLQPPVSTETNANKIRKINTTMKDLNGLTTENNELTDNILRDGTFMKEFISILSNQQKSISILQYQEDFLFDTPRMNKLKNLTANNIPPNLVLKVNYFNYLKSDRYIR
jgi:hypothetical protein